MGTNATKNASVVLLSISIYGYFSLNAPPVPDLAQYAKVAPAVSRMYAADGTLLGEFANAVHGQGLVPCLFTVTSETSRHARAQGWHSLQVAEEAWIELPTLDFVGKSWQDVRTAMNQAAKLGIRFRIGPLADMPRGIQMQVKAISSEWVEDKGLPEMGFTLGGVDEALDRNVRVGLAIDADSTVHGITSWMPFHDVGGGEPVGWTLDDYKLHAIPVTTMTVEAQEAHERREKISRDD